MNPPAADCEELFWRLAEALYADPAVSRSTMMGFPCLRASGKFFACVDRRTGSMVVKLPELRVTELVATGAGVPFAPNGKVFREWIAFPVPDDEEWPALLDEAEAFTSA